MKTNQSGGLEEEGRNDHEGVARRCGKEVRQGRSSNLPDWELRRIGPKRMINRLFTFDITRTSA